MPTATTRTIPTSISSLRSLTAIAPAHELLTKHSSSPTTELIRINTGLYLTAIPILVSCQPTNGNSIDIEKIPDARVHCDQQRTARVERFYHRATEFAIFDSAFDRGFMLDANHESGGMRRDRKS